MEPRFLGSHRTRDGPPEDHRKGPSGQIEIDSCVLRRRSIVVAKCADGSLRAAEESSVACWFPIGFFEKRFASPVCSVVRPEDPRSQWKVK